MPQRGLPGVDEAASFSIDIAQSFATTVSIRHSNNRLEEQVRQITTGPDSTPKSTAQPSIPIGRINTFGPFGPKYEVGQALRQLDDGDWMIEITLIESGEKAEYRLREINDDPVAG